MRILFAIVSFSFSLILASAPAYANCRNPKFLKKADKDPKLACSLLDALEVYACNDGKKGLDAAMKAFKEKINSACTAIEESANTTGCGLGQEECMRKNAEKRAEAQKFIDGIVTALREQRAEIAKAKKDLRDALVKKEKVVDPTTKVAAQVRDWHGTNTSENKGELDKAKDSLTKNFADTGKKVDPESRSTITSANDGKSKSNVLEEATKAINALSTFQGEIDDEIGRLQTLANGLGKNSKTLDSRAKKQGPADKSNVSGGQPQQQADSGKQPEQAGGGAPPGGGSPGGGSPAGGGAPSSDPSTLTDSNYPGAEGTSPTPDSLNNSPGAKTDDVARDANGKPIGGGVVGGIDPKKKNSDGTPVADSPYAPVSGSSFPAKASGGSLAKNLRKSLAAKSGSVGGGGGGGGAGSSDSAPYAEVPPGLPAAGSGGTTSLGGDGGGGGGDDLGGGEDVLSPFGKPLSDPKFSLAGSETDASVKNMMDGFGLDSDGGAEGERFLASDVADGIGERNGPSLFERAKMYHNRCAQKGCVTAFRRKMTSGG